jgi:acyl carrier protein
LDVYAGVLEVLDDVLSLQGRARRLAPDAALLGSVPELDSMAFASVIAALEERYGFVVDDDEIDGATFATVGSLADFVKAKLNA